MRKITKLGIAKIFNIMFCTAIIITAFTLDGINTQNRYIITVLMLVIICFWLAAGKRIDQHNDLYERDNAE